MFAVTALAFAQVPTNGLVAWYPFNGNANDSSGNGNNAIVHGAALTADRFGNLNKAYSFDGASSYLIASASALPTADWTMSVWFLSTNLSPGAAIMAYGGSSCGTSSILDMNNHDSGLNKYSFQGGCEVNRLDAPYPSSPGYTWHHLVLTTSRSGTAIYLDGQRIGSDTTYVNNTYVAGKDLIIGACVNNNGIGAEADQNAGYFPGSLDDIRIYNRALSSYEVQLLYHEGGWAPPPSPQNLTATAGNAQVTLKWNKNTEPDFLKYRIYRGTSSGGESLVDSTSAGITDTTRVEAGLTNGTTYYFKVTTVDSARLESGYSNEVSAIPQSGAQSITIDLRDSIFQAYVYSANSQNNWTTSEKLYLKNSNGWATPWDLGTYCWGEFEKYGTVYSGGGPDNDAVYAPTDSMYIATVGEYTLHYPDSISLKYGLADGRQTTLANVRFVVQVKDNVGYNTLLDYTINDSAGWRSFNSDLSKWNNSVVTLRLITDPNGTTAEDWSYWADMKVSETEFCFNSGHPDPRKPIKRRYRCFNKSNSDMERLFWRCELQAPGID